MNGFTKIALRASLYLLVSFALLRGAAGTVDDAQSFALQAAEPYVKEGFQVREDYWGGDLGSGDAIKHPRCECACCGIVFIVSTGISPARQRQLHGNGAADRYVIDLEGKQAPR